MKAYAQSLQLVGDGDEEDILRDIEQTFSIHIWDEEAGQLKNTGDLFELILKKMGSKIELKTESFENISLERLQKPIEEIAGYKISPDTNFADFLPSGRYKKHKKTIEDGSGLSLPQTDIRLPNSQIPFLFLLFASPLLAWFFFNQFEWNSLYFLSGWLFILPIKYFEKYEILYPNLGILAKAVAGKNYRRLYKETGSSSKADVWQALVYLLHRDSGVLIPIEQISAETKFFD